MAASNHGNRLGTLETSLAQLSTQVGEFIQDSRAYRDRQEREQAKVWETIEKIANKGALSWPVVAMTIGLILSIVGTAAGLGHAFMESRMKQVEIHLEYQKEAILRNRDQLDGLDVRLSK